MNKSLLYVIGTALVVAIAFWGGMKFKETRMSSIETASGDCALKMAMRKLWEGHITLTHNYIVSALAELEDLNAVTNKLLENQDDIGNAIKPFYGDEAGTALTALLKDHILLAAEVVKAAKENNKQALDAANKKWYQNADDLAAFLSGANPNWSEAVLRDMFYKHLEYVTAQTVARLNKNWVEDLVMYDKNHDHMFMLSDMLADGIIKQFPEKF